MCIYYIAELEKMRLFNESEKYLNKIGSSIKKLVPLEAEMSTENIIMPTVGDQADCSKRNTCHVDEFLYDDDQVEELVKSKKFYRHYCMDCGSRNVEVSLLNYSDNKKPIFLYSYSQLTNLLYTISSCTIIIYPLS